MCMTINRPAQPTQSLATYVPAEAKVVVELLLLDVVVPHVRPGHVIVELLSLRWVVNVISQSVKQRIQSDLTSHP